jgi:hypothetical protein
MNGQGFDRVYDALVATSAAEPQQRLEAACRLCVDLLHVTGAGVMLMADRTHHRDARAPQLPPAAG